MGTVMRSEDAEVIRPYVEFMNANTVKSSPDSKVFLKGMAEAVQRLRVKGLYRSDPGISPLDRQLLLEDIGHAWIRKGLPVAEIDWLP